MEHRFAVLSVVFNRSPGACMRFSVRIIDYVVNPQISVEFFFVMAENSIEIRCVGAQPLRVHFVGRRAECVWVTPRF